MRASSKDVDAGVRQLDSGVRKIPGYAVKVAESVEQHGIAALAYEDPEMKRAGREIGLEVWVVVSVTSPSRWGKIC